MLSNIIKYLVIILIASGFVVGLVRFFLYSKTETKSELKQRAKNNKILSLFSFLMAVVLCLGYAAGLMIGKNSYATADITLNYAEASLGQNANGTRYNMSEIICDEVIERLIKKGGFEDLEVSDFKNCFTVAPLVEGSSYSKENYHISTEFTVTYTANRKTSSYDAGVVVDLLCNSYRDYYLDKYMADFTILETDFAADLENLDYYDKTDYLSKEAEKILNYLYGLHTKNSAFVSSTGATFASVESKILNLKQTQISNNLSSFILQNGIANNTTAVLDRLAYQNKQSAFEKDRNSNGYTITNNAVAKYAEEMATVVLVPTWDKTGEYYMGRTKVGIDELSVQSVNYSSTVASIVKSIDTNKLELNRFSAAAGNTKQNKAIADNMAEDIKVRLIKFAEEARAIGQEYYANRMNQCISATVNETSILGSWKTLAVIFVLGYVSAWVFRLGSKQNRREEV